MSSPTFRDRLARLEQRLEELNALLADPSIQGDSARIVELGREHGETTHLVGAARKVVDLEDGLDETRAMLDEEADPDMRVLVADEVATLEGELTEARATLEELLLPDDPNDARDVLLEIRAGTGGDEAALFCGDLLRMYLRFAEQRGWTAELLSSSASDLGGYKEVIASVRGRKVFSVLKHESGTHRVQRVPATERQGRIHTSAVTVAVLPEAEEVEVDVQDKDLRIDVYRSQGAGGQHVNTTDSAVRITHLPTGIVVACQDERSQIQNRARAMQILRARLLADAQQRQADERAAERKSQVGTGDRSGRIRTYNYPQNRVTDHRINLTLRSLDQIMEGDLGPVVDALVDEERKERLLAAQEA